MQKRKTEAKVLSIGRAGSLRRAPTAGSGHSGQAARGAPGPFEKRLPAPVRDTLEEIRSRSSRLVTSVNEYGYDPFGYNRDGSIYLTLLGVALYRWWFRVEAHGIEHLPTTGPVLIVGNHAGNFAWDAAMVMMATFLEAEPPRLARGLAEYYLPTLPILADLMVRIGSVVGTPENCRQLFERGECVMVFPEGARGAVKPYSKAYQLQRFGLGFMRMALEHRVPVLPVGIVGAEESNPALHDSKLLARLVGSPGFPIPATLPLFGPLSVFLPLPAKFHLNFGPLLHFEGDHDAEDAEIDPRVERVRGEIARLVAVGLSQRRSWFF
ncbi:MAG: lysophospholipid acyltransferase family protein [Candidatus Binatia bacterium]